MKLRTLSLLVALVMAAASCGGSDPVSGTTNAGATDQSSDSAAAPADAAAPAESVSGGIINVLGVDYLFDAPRCFVDATGFNTDGFGETADGVPFRATVSLSIQTRQGMEDSGLPQANIDAFFGDKDSLEALTVELELGKADGFTPAEEGMADFSLNLIDAADAEGVSYRIEGNKLSGSGQISDTSGLLIPFGETAGVNFSSFCNWTG